jgi:Putative Ig domain
LKRIIFLCVLAAAIVGVSVSGASGASFNDSTPCPTQAQFFTCPTGVVGKPYSIQLIGQGGCDLYWFELLNSSLPAGLSMNTSGVISGVPTGAGRAEFYVQIHDLLPSQGGYPWCGGDNKSQKQFALTIDPGLAIRNQSVKPGTIGQAYSETLTAAVVVSVNPFNGTDVPATWSLQSGTLPTGVTLAANGVLSGTPAQEGSFQFVVRAENGGKVDTETLVLSVRQPVVISSAFKSPTTPPKSEVGVPFNATLTATGGSGTFTWALASGSLPGGVTFTPETATLAGTPTVAGRYTFAITATDTEGRVTTLNATLVVADELSIETEELPVGTAGRLYSAQLETVGGVTPTTWSVLRGTLPSGIRLNKKLGELRGITRRTGTFPLTLQAVDALGVTSQLRVPLVVTAPLVIKTLKLPAAKAGVPYRAKVVATGGLRPTKWKLLRGTLPSGIRFNKKLGVFVGTTQQTGAFLVTVQIVDSLGAKTQSRFTLTVLP